MAALVTSLVAICIARASLLPQAAPARSGSCGRDLSGEEPWRQNVSTRIGHAAQDLQDDGSLIACWSADLQVPIGKLDVLAADRHIDQQETGDAHHQKTSRA
jgi:hypothetical protein